jgi:hypothetical protein
MLYGMRCRECINAALYSLHLNCTYSNYTKLLQHIQLHNSTAHLLYKLNCLQLKCTYNNYTETAATCSAAQQHSTFIVQTVQTVQSATELYLQ